jgi:hypothetical protein
VLTSFLHWLATTPVLQWNAQDTLEPGKVTLAEQIIRAGLVELPTSMFMIVLHSSFLIEVQSSFQSGYTELQVSRLPVLTKGPL